MADAIVVTDGEDGAEEGAEAVEAAAEATEAAAEAVEAAAEGAEAVAEAAEEVAAEAGAEGGASEGELERAERLAVLQRDHEAHVLAEHPTQDDMRAVARSVLWEEAEGLAQYAADLAAQDEPDDSEVTIVTPDIDESDKSERGLRRFL